MQDPNEPIELCDGWGRPLGRVRSRAEIHRDGDWHRSFHCWVVAPGGPGAGAIVLQRRSAVKETWPGLWDVSVAGHYAAGEGIDGGLREIREELGIEVDRDELLLAGWRREEVRYPNGLIEREVQDVYFLQRPVDLMALDPEPTEVSAVALIAPAALAALGDGRLARCTVAARAIGGPAAVDLAAEDLRSGSMPAAVVLAAEALVPRADRYYQRVARLATRLLAGGTVRRRRWWGS